MAVSCFFGMSVFYAVKKSSISKDVYSVLENFSKNHSPVLFFGERGSGKETFARFLAGFQFPEANFIKIDCRNSLENIELKTRLKENTVCFFDEVGFLSMEDQKRVLDLMKLYEPFDQNGTKIRFLFSSSQNLEENAETAEFLPSLYDRLKYVVVKIPSLRERKEDIIYFFQFFCTEFNRRYGKNITGISAKAKNMLEQYSWPENIEELKSVASLAVLKAERKIISCSDLETGLNNYKNSDIMSVGFENTMTLKNALDNFKRSYLIRVLNSVNWNQTEAAKILDIQRTYLSKLIGELKIKNTRRGKYE